MTGITFANVWALCSTTCGNHASEIFRRLNKMVVPDNKICHGFVK